MLPTIFDGALQSIRSAPPLVHHSLFFLLEHLNHNHVPCGILSDQKSSVIVYRTVPDDRAEGPFYNRLSYKYVSADVQPIRGVIAWGVWKSVWDLGMTAPDYGEDIWETRLRHSCKGLPNDIQMKLEKQKPQKVPSIECRCSDFELFTEEDWNSHRQLKAEIQEVANNQVLRKGSELMMVSSLVEFRPVRMKQWFPPLPKKTLSVINSNRRPRLSHLDAMLRKLYRPYGVCGDHCKIGEDPEDCVVGSKRSGGTKPIPFEFHFTIDKVLSSGPDRWSQVFLGRISGCDDVVCLKLFDERYFAVPEEDGLLFERHSCFRDPDDLAQQEESVYHRLSDFQGSLLPHCYGFHQVSSSELSSSIILIETYVVHNIGWPSSLWSSPGGY